MGKKSKHRGSSRNDASVSNGSSRSTTPRRSTTACGCGRTTSSTRSSGATGSTSTTPARGSSSPTAGCSPGRASTSARVCSSRSPSSSRMGELEEFERQIPSALAAGATPREVLEIILQATVYIGYVRAGQRRAHLREGPRAAGPPRRNHGDPASAGRTHAGALARRGAAKMARCEDRREETAWRERFSRNTAGRASAPASARRTIRATTRIDNYDRIDPHYLELWFDFIYGELYPRGIIDDRTRLLMMVGRLPRAERAGAAREPHPRRAAARRERRAKCWRSSSSRRRTSACRRPSRPAACWIAWRRRRTASSELLP